MAHIDCVCPPRADGTARHPNGDTVTLREKLDFRSGVQARKSLVILKQEDPDADLADILAGLSELYVLVGIESWTLQDQRGKPVEVNRGTVRAFMADHPSEAMDVAEEADELYSAGVIEDLLKLAAKSSQPTQTDDSTSVTPPSSPTPRKPSKRSLTTSSLTDGTATTSASPVGAYS